MSERWPFKIRDEDLQAFNNWLEEQTNSLHQCNSCKLEGKRSCTYHGYPRNNIPDSCSYKIGVHAEEALKNLNGTYIDIWTKEHVQQIRAQVLEEVYTRMEVEKEIVMLQSHYREVILWTGIDGIFKELKGDVRK